MTQTNTDYLLQMTSAVTDRTYSAPATNQSGGKFDVHLSQAATSSEDDLLGRGGPQRMETARYDRDDRSWSTRSSSSTNQNNSSSTSSRSSAADQAPSVADVSESKPPETDSDDEADDTSAAEAAAGQTASSNTAKADSKPKPNKSSDAATAKAASVAKKAKTEDGESDKAGKAGGQATPDESSTVEVPQETEIAAQLAVDAAGDPAASNEEAIKSQETATEGKRSKAAKGEAAGLKSKQAAVSNNGEECGDSSAVATTKEPSANVNQEAIASAEVSAASTDATATKEKTKTDDSSDDVRSRSPNDNRSSAHDDLTAVASKVDTWMWAGGVPATPGADSNTPSKGEDNEQATKPIGAKGEPVGAAFARMARNNIVGTNDSTAGTNDLPQVDPSRFIGRVAKAFRTAQDRGGTLQLRLSPPELGALRIELNVKDGVMSASLQTENSNARRLLLDHLPALRDRLAEQNIRVDRFDVDVRDDSAGQSGARGSQQQQFQHQSDQPAPRRTVPSQPRPRDVTAPERIARSPIIGDAGLNLIV